jgi:flagellar export protein FliJ
MTRHEFRLHRIKRVRAVEEDIERARFGEAESIARAAEDAAERARAFVATAVDDLRGLQGAPSLEPATVLAVLTFVDEARAALRAAEQHARAQRAEAEARRQAWLARVRDLEGLERLEEHSRDEFHREQERTEARAMDETASQRAAHARRIRTTERR